MRKIALWLGVALYVFGVALILANVVMSYRGVNASYNFGDPTRFQYFLVSFWQAGLAIAAIGVACLIACRLMTR